MAEQPKTQRCGQCRFWKMRDEEIGENGNLVYRDSTMVCKRYPPGLPERAGFILPARETNLGRYPLTLSHHWCGEYQPANPQTVTEAAMAISRQLMRGDVIAAQGVLDKFQEDQANV